MLSKNDMENHQDMYQDEEHLRRYTSIESVLTLFDKGTIQFSNPEYWEDKNDSEVIKNNSGIEQIWALCFTHAAETTFHWKSFAPDNDSCCICFSDTFSKFMKSKYNELDIGTNDASPLFKKIEYKRLKGVTGDDNPLFTKRFPYENEKEWRVIVRTKKTNKEVPELKINLKYVYKIILSPTLNAKPLLKKLIADKIRESIKVSKNSAIKVYTSGVYRSKDWIKKLSPSLKQVETL